MIRFVDPSDAIHLSTIYNHYIENSFVTLDEQFVTEQDMLDLTEKVSGQFPWLVYELNGQIVGYAYASPWKSRCAFRFSAETTVYLAPGHFRKGFGFELYRRLIHELKKTTCHSLIAGIALPNEASIALHEKLKFEKIGHFKEVGRKFEKWIDVGYWELLLS